MRHPRFCFFLGSPLTRDVKRPGQALDVNEPIPVEAPPRPSGGPTRAAPGRWPVPSGVGRAPVLASHFNTEGRKSPESFWIRGVLGSSELYTVTRTHEGTCCVHTVAPSETHLTWAVRCVSGCSPMYQSGRAEPVLSELDQAERSKQGPMDLSVFHPTPQEDQGIKEQ